MADSIFTKIIRGEIPSHKIYEDELTFVFLDNNPIQLGHTLVIPRKQADYIWDLPAEDYVALMNTVKKVGSRLKKVLGTKYVGIEVIGVDVLHAHVHVIPFNTVAEFRGEENRPTKVDDATQSELAAQLAF